MLFADAATIEDDVHTAVEDGKTSAGRAHQARFRVLGGLLEHLLG